MKTSYFLRFLLPLTGLLLTSCEPSGQLLVGGLSPCVTAGLAGAGVVAFIASRLQRRPTVA